MRESFGKKPRDNEFLKSQDELDIEHIPFDDETMYIKSSDINPELRKNVEIVLDTLKPREKRIIELRFFEGKTLKEAAKECKLSVDRTRMIEKRALRKIRHPIRMQMIFPNYPDDLEL